MYWVILLLVVVLCYLWLKWHYRYWTRLGIPQCNPVFILGDSWKHLLRVKSGVEALQDMYNAAPNARYFGIYQLLKPILVIRDPDLIKQITIKDFEHFVDHQGLLNTENEPLFGKSVGVLKGQRWKEMRSTLSPAFTSSKMKNMFVLISKTGQQFAEYFLKEDKGIITIDVKNNVSKFTTDVIANAAFGVEFNSLTDPNNEFFKMASKALNLTSFRTVCMLVLNLLLSTRLIKLFGVKFFNKELEAYFINIIKENIAIREKEGVVRPDLIHLLLEARKQRLKYEECDSVPETGFATVEDSQTVKEHKSNTFVLSDEDITAQAFFFFIAGFEIISTFISLLSYELAVNLDVQEKLKQEIDNTIRKCKKEVTYDALMSMKYMDMVVSEGMRKWPISGLLDRVCTKSYTIEPKLPNEQPVHIEKGSSVLIFIYPTHRDPNYYPEPDRFDPERFSEENRKNITPYTYFPFGLGPRACIASRFALLEIKIFFFQLLKCFQLVPVDKTQVPLVLSKKAFTLTPEGVLWLGLKRWND